jgi:hypothetical protein
MKYCLFILVAIFVEWYALLLLILEGPGSFLDLKATYSD